MKETKEIIRLLKTKRLPGSQNWSFNVSCSLWTACYEFPLGNNFLTYNNNSSFIWQTFYHLLWARNFPNETCQVLSLITQMLIYQCTNTVRNTINYSKVWVIYYLVRKQQKHPSSSKGERWKRIRWLKDTDCHGADVIRTHTGTCAHGGTHKGIRDIEGNHKETGDLTEEK